MGNQIDNAINEILKSIQYLINSSLKSTTKIYEGIIISNNNNGYWNVKYNGETHSIAPYGNITPVVGQNVKVIIPQGNQSVAFFI